MIWYLLYPFRGTAEAPILAPNHPLRSAFARYGRYASRHVVSTLLLSVAVATVLVYPFPFLYTTDFTNGASNLPHHVWTDAQPLDENAAIEPDLIMRSIWVHGDYFQALDRKVLLGALELQDELLGPTVDFHPRQVSGSGSTTPQAALGPSQLSIEQRNAYHIINGLTDESWFFHSPLQYWDCDPQKIADERNILSTVNERKTQPTSVNVTLRHSIVFSGKRFEDRRLVAADALVITLVHRRNSPMGRIWQDKAQELAARMADKYDIYPSNGFGMPSQLYEFQFRPMSFQDTLALILAYSLTLSYFVVSLTKLRAVKSKVGLVVTVVTQLFVSIMSSFTVCAILKIDLSKIPSFAYPVVILSMSLENIFRLINAVILTPAEDSTSHRIGQAFGETTHIALASVAQNLLILWGLSKVVSPGVQAFCTFAAIAILFDFFYLSTFFLSVLSVDVRRTELSDALNKASIRNYRSQAEIQARQSWADAMLQGKIAISTRVAGTTVMVGFVLIAQWHFFENESLMKALGRITRLSKKYDAFGPARSSLLVDVHQARSPTSWLRLQDHETAREVIHVIKPNAHSYIARVVDPLVFVLKGADRMLSAKERPFLPAVYDFIHHQSIPFLLVVLVLTAAVRLLMNYLLWDELADSNHNDNSAEEPPLEISTLSGGHTLDVVMLTASSDGLIVSVGLDRYIRVWDVKAEGASYILPGHDQLEHTFPKAMCVYESHWLALLTTDTVLLWDLHECRWGPCVSIEPCRYKPEAFFFTANDLHGLPRLVLVRRNGTMVEIRPDEEEAGSFVISHDSVIVSVDALVEKFKPTTKIMSSSREGRVFCLSQDPGRAPGGWECNSVDIDRPLAKEFMSIVALPELGYLLVVRTQSVDLVDAADYVTLHSFRTDPIQPRSLKCFHSQRRQMQCGSVGLKFLTFAYLNAYTRDLVVQNYTPQHDGESICFRTPGQPVSKTCCQWPRTRETRRLVKDPGVWEALPAGMLVGARKKSGPKPASSSRPPMQNDCGGMRRRRNSLCQTTVPRPVVHDDWEVWMLSQMGKGETWETMPLCADDDNQKHLFVSNLGPMTRIGRGSVALALSNVIKVIMVAHERFDGGGTSLTPGNALQSVASRRRTKPALQRSRPSYIQ